jgi:hypothetical protein
MITFEDDTCTAPLPENLEIFSAHFGGHAVAECKLCNFKSVFWDCAHELEHDCEEYK